MGKADGDQGKNNECELEENDSLDGEEPQELDVSYLKITIPQDAQARSDPSWIAKYPKLKMNEFAKKNIDP